MWNTLPTRKLWNVTNIKIKIDYRKSAINLKGGKKKKQNQKNSNKPTTLWNNFNIPFQKLMAFKSNFNFTDRSLIRSSFFNTRIWIFLNKKSQICQLHEIFFSRWLTGETRQNKQAVRSAHINNFLGKHLLNSTLSEIIFIMEEK